MQEKREDIRGERREKFDNLSMLGQISDAEGRRAAKKRRDSRLFEVFKGLIFSIEMMDGLAAPPKAPPV